MRTKSAAVGIYEVSRMAIEVAPVLIAFAAIMISASGCSGTKTVSDISKSNTEPEKANGSNSSKYDPDQDKPEFKLGLQPSQGQTTSDVSSIHFTSIKDSGINYLIDTGADQNFYTMIESLGVGLSVLDFDNDGLYDVAIAGGGTFDQQKNMYGKPGDLLRGVDPFHFESVAALALFSTESFYSHSASISDLNNDGFDDILVTGFNGLQYFINQGDGTFLEASQRMGIASNQWTGCVSVGDVQQDGYPDFVVSSYGNWSMENNPPCFQSDNPNIRATCTPRLFDGYQSNLFISNGDGTFRNASEESGITEKGRSLGVLLADLDDDRDIDCYIANDLQANFLYRNDGQGKFKEIGIRSGAATDAQGIGQGSMGIALGDYNTDGQFDLFVTNFANELPALYVGQKKGLFRNQTGSAKIGLLKEHPVSWGTAFIDLENDGDEDIVVVNGHFESTRVNHLQKPSLLINQGDNTYMETRDDAGEFFQTPLPSRALASCDFDHDGLVEIIVSNMQQPNSLLRNTSRNAGKYLDVRLIGTKDIRNAVGAVAKLESGKQSWVRQAVVGGSYMATSSPILHFGVGNAPTLPAQLTVTWLDGQSSKVEIREWNQTVIVIQ